MANSFFNMSFSGRLGRDAEMRYSQKGTAIIKMGIAVNLGRWNKVESKFEPMTMWINTTLFGEYWEKLMSKLTKGAEVIVEVDRLEFDAETGGPVVFTRKSGDPGSSFNCVARKVTVVGVQAQEGAAREPVKDDQIPF